MATIILTQQGTGLSFSLDESQIMMVRTDAGGSYVERSDPFNTGFNGSPLFVTQTPLAIAQQSENLINLTISKTGDQWTSVYLNGSVNHFGSIQADTTTALGNSRFEYFHNGSTMEIYLAIETPAQINALVQQVKNESNSSAQVDVSGATVLTAAQLATGYIDCAGGAYNLTFPDGTALYNQLKAKIGSTFTFVVSKEAPGALGIVLGANTVNGNVAPAANVGASRSAVYMIAFSNVVGTPTAVISQLV